MAKKVQSTRLTTQHRKTHGAIGIFGGEAKLHDLEVSTVSKLVCDTLKTEFSSLTFRYRDEVTKKEINEALHRVDASLGQTLFVAESKIKPDGGLVEVRDDNGVWRVSWFQRQSIREKTSKTSRRVSWSGKIQTKT